MMAAAVRSSRRSSTGTTKCRRAAAVMSGSQQALHLDSNAARGPYYLPDAAGWPRKTSSHYALPPRGEVGGFLQTMLSLIVDMALGACVADVQKTALRKR